MRYCKSCILPDARPNLLIGSDGICNACASHATKRVIDWKRRHDIALEEYGITARGGQGTMTILKVRSPKPEVRSSEE